MKEGSYTSSGIRARDDEIQQIISFITSRLESKKSGTLYITGQPGIGKTMCLNYALDQIKGVSIFNLNCFKFESANQIITRLCRATQLDEFTKFNENVMLERLTKKFTNRASKPQIIVLDEVDQMPKSNNVQLSQTIFSWPQQVNSKLILICIANTVNLTSRSISLSLVSGLNLTQVTKIVFRPYTSKDISEILQWYLENDENFEDASIDKKALELISKKYAKEKGDIRGALNALRSAIDDTNRIKKIHTPDIHSSPEHDTNLYPTPPATPPMTPCKDKTTSIASVVNSVKKRQKEYDFEESFPFPHQVMLLCLQRLSQQSENSGVESRKCKSIAASVLKGFQIKPTKEELIAILDNLEIQGLINFKKVKNGTIVHLKATETQLLQLINRHDMINELLERLI